MAELPIVAIIGGTGHIGQHITTALLSSNFRPQFREVVVLSRQPTKPGSQLAKWKDDRGAILRTYDEDNLAKSIGDVDILISAIGSSGNTAREKLLKVLPSTKVSVYFPSEFGVDPDIHDFSQEEWNRKREHMAQAKGSALKARICRVHCGLFLDDIMGPWLGLDVDSGKFESVGDASTPVSYTSLADAGKAVARLATMHGEVVPEKVYIAGDTISVAGIADLVEKAGVGHVVVSEVNLQEYKEKIVKEEPDDPWKYLRFLMGEGKIDNRGSKVRNLNELINPNEKYWNWKKFSDVLNEKIRESK